ncbi:MAG: micrococcal nuclease [Alphaproteobacteria bacterium]|jgi:micrococcal nuclease
MTMIKNSIKMLFIIGLVLSTQYTLAFSQGVTWKKVDHVIDGDTFVTKDGSHIKLLGINTPEIGRRGKKNQPFANEARLKLTELIFHEDLRLEFGDLYKDRYGRLLAHAYKKDGIWVNAKLIEESLAHVYSFPDNRGHTRELIKIENKTKLNKQGMWGHARWKTHSTDDKIPDTAIGQFNIIEGKVHHITKVKNKTYLNFGADWRTDFTVEIKKKYYDSFKQSGIDIAQDYAGKSLQIRGVFKSVNGVLITITHPEQLTILP